MFWAVGGLVWGRVEGAMGSWGVKGEGGKVSWEERRGVVVGVIERVERIFSFWGLGFEMVLLVWLLALVLECGCSVV